MDIQADNLHFQYEGLSPQDFALAGISFTLKGSECVALVGPSGSGKSTLAQLLNGLLFPTSGRLLFNGEVIPDRSPRQRDLRRKVALVFQFPEAQIFESTVFDEIAFAARQYGLAEELFKSRVETALQVVGLDAAAFQDRNPMKLSGGEDRLVTIASLLVVDPEWLILDEPTLGLDYPHKLKIKALIDKRHQEGKGILLITHDLDLVLAVCPRVLVLSGGRLVFDGSTREVMLKRDLAGEFGLADAESVRLWKHLREHLPDLNIPDPNDLEEWLIGLPDSERGQVGGVIEEVINRRLLWAPIP